MTIEEMIAEVERRGYRLANLFRRQSGEWQASLTDHISHFAYSRADTAPESLRLAILDLPDRPGALATEEEIDPFA